MIHGRTTMQQARMGPDLMETIRDMLRYLPARSASAVVAVSSIVVLTRLFSPQEYGIYTLFLTVSSMFSVASATWVGSAAMRFLALSLSPAETRHVLLVTLKLGGGVALAAGLLLAASMLPISGRTFSTNTVVLAAAFATIVLAAVWELLLSMLRGRRLAGDFSRFSVWSNIGSLLLGLGFVFVFDMGIAGLIAGMLIAHLVALPMLLRRAFVHVTEAGPLHSSPVASIGALLAYGWPVLVINFSTWVLERADRYVVQVLRGAHELGVYSANYAIGEWPTVFLNSMVLLASTPIGFRVWDHEGVLASSSYLIGLTRYYVLATMPLVVGLASLATPLARVFLAEGYQSGYPIIGFVATAGLLAGIAHRYTVVLSYSRQTSLLMVCYLISGAFNIVATIALVERYGGLGAAVATMMSYALLLVTAVVASRRIMTWRFPTSTLVRAAVASGAMAAVLAMIIRGLHPYPLLSVVIGLGLGGLVYVVSILAMGEVRVHDMIRAGLSFRQRTEPRIDL